MKRISIPGAMTLLGLAVAFGAEAQTLEAVKARGNLICGVNQGLDGFSKKDAAGAWSGFDVDFCRAVASAIFADGSKVQFVPVSASERFDVLRDGKVDILSRNSTWTLSRELQYGISFAGITYFDGQGFMVRRAANVDSALELNNSKVCVQKDTTTRRNQADYFESNSMKYEAVLTDSPQDSLDRYQKKECSVVTSDVSQLYSAKQALPDAGDQIILPEVISKEPLGPSVREGDPKWRDLVQWVHFAMLDAEELGVSQSTLAQAEQSSRPSVRRLLGKDGNIGQTMGLSNDWVANIVKLVGNYGEVYERNLGTNSKLGIPRGLNELWSLGGIQYAPPAE
jgi:general L-amino acid transport system substrate-binding protein